MWWIVRPDRLSPTTYTAYIGSLQNAPSAPPSIRTHRLQPASEPITKYTGVLSSAHL
ncbi:hypothetical protein BDD12DRAFT_198479 [Trichophaea hybrida]|nr:hypothetical protein BDD12DRAFT_198479 [Trichophaea hybrida]